MVEKQKPRVEIDQPLGIYAGQAFERARQYQTAFEILGKDESGDVLLPEYFLLAHSVELYLKSYLAAVEAKDKRQLHNVGHRLLKLYQMSLKANLPKVDEVSWLVRQLNEMNSDHDFRYPSGFRLSMPRPSECSQWLTVLVGQIQPTVSSRSVKANLRLLSQYPGHLITWLDEPTRPRNVLPQDLNDHLDKWIMLQPEPRPTRAEAIESAIRGLLKT